MRCYNTFIILICGLLVSSITGCQSVGPFANQSPPEDTTVVATFADEELHMDAFERRYVRTVGSIERARQDSLPQYADFLERYVNFRLKVIDAKRRGMDANLYSNESEVSSRPGHLAESFLVSEARSNLLRELYERRQEDADVSVLVARFGDGSSPQDTLEAYQRIHALRDSIEAGMPFSEAAVRFSDAPTARRDSGHVGYVPAGRAYRSFENRMFNTPVGEMSAPFRSSGGYYLMKVHDRRPSYPERRISHIMLPPPEDGDTSRVYRQLEMLRDSLEQGADFGELATQYSAHRQTAGNGGDFGWMSYIEARQAVPEFAEAVWNIDTIGAVADTVLKSRYGYHLVKITDERDFSTFEAATPYLKERFNELPRSKNLEQKTANRLLEKHGRSVDTTAIEEAIAHLPSENRWTTILNEGFENGYENRAFASIGDSTYTFGQLESQIQDVPMDTTVTAKLYHNVDRFLRDQVYEYMVPKLRAENPEFRRILDEYQNGVLLFQVAEETVWNPAQQDTAALRALYEESGESYRFPERYRTIVFETFIDSTLESVITALDRGTDVSSLQTKLRQTTSNLKIDTVFVSDSTNLAYSEVLELEPGEHTGIVSRDGRDMVLYLDAIEEPRQKTFAEARTDLVRTYQQQLEREWIAELHDRYDVRLYPERLRYAFRDSTISDEPLDNPMPSSVVSD